MASYYDSKKKKYVVQDGVERKEFSGEPSAWDYVKESFQPTTTRAELDALRKRRRKQNG